MLNNVLKEIPGPSVNKTGWPWTEESSGRGYRESSELRWPKITIVTPSFNQGEFIEKTIRSVILQNYPNLEYFIMDGGSSDGTVEIIKKYKKWITCWESSKDQGQTHAIDKGFIIGTGVILAYLNSDDFLMKNTLFYVAKKMKRQKTNWLSGRCLSVDKNDRILSCAKPFERRGIAGWVLGKCYLPQPATFWKAEALRRIGGFDISLHYSMDYDVWTRFAFAGYKPYLVNKVLAGQLIHHKSKSSGNIKGWNNDGLIRKAKINSELTQKDAERVQKYRRYCQRCEAIYEETMSGKINIGIPIRLIGIIIKNPLSIVEKCWINCVKRYILNLFQNRDVN